MGKRSKEEVLKGYIKTTDFWADFLGKEYEIVIHDVESVEKSIIYIRNNFSGRKIGGSITDLGLRILKENEYTDDEYFVNYTSKTIDGKIIRSATYFIKDDDDKIIAMMCVNIDVTKAKFFSDYLQEFLIGQKVIPSYNLTSVPNKKDISEALYDSIEDVAHHMINEALSHIAVPVNRMTLDEKKEIISELDKKGFFLIKGSVKVVSQKLEVSETTVYRSIGSYKPNEL
ncbi:helix-turn-helix transcriptional regulator [Abyssisolibacter fermentans]|uniref:helix-turn-helix transcriptional regulator n=1 Tax=Abyssisolibacter fermentans TaxID=1766203 RepID=UPI0008306C73|nr:PAS domain-containing protein [Abyssisolibacter fermentans]